jgi:hypothetical protein
MIRIASIARAALYDVERAGFVAMHTNPPRHTQPQLQVVA